MYWSRRLLVAGMLALVLLTGLPEWVAAQGDQDIAVPFGQPAQLTATGAAQMAVLAMEKQARTPAQQKMSSRLLLALRRWRHEAIMNALPSLQTPIADENGRILVDIDLVNSEGLDEVLDVLRSVNAKVIHHSAEQRAVRALAPLDQTELLAALPQVRNIREADQAIVNAMPHAAWSLNAGVTSEGDWTHLANRARQLYGVTGAGQKICVLSDGINSLAASQASGDLPPDVEVLPGKAGLGDEGTAVLEIVHDLAPDAVLGFATGIGGVAAFADNIRSLRQHGCTIIIDDINYFIESPFQDSAIAQAVIDVTNAGAMYFSSAANDGNLDSATSGTWEGDFNANGTIGLIAGGSVHNFGDGGQSNQLTRNATVVLLHWSDPYGASGNDYDLYVLDAALSEVLAASTDWQGGTGNPYEFVTDIFPVGSRVVVVRKDGAANRMINVLASRSRLQIGTAGSTRGHSAASPAISVAAAPAAIANSTGGPTGPYPNAYTGADQVEWFSSDGPRRIFFDYLGNLLPGAPSGNFSAGGGVVRQKPDITAADGVLTSLPGYAPFFGTSASAPHAAAIAALLKQAFPLSSTLEIRNLLQLTALDIMGPGVDRNSGAGIVMPVAALAAGGAQARSVLSKSGLATVELAGNGNAAIDPSETWQLTIPLSNTGGAVAAAISATLTSSNAGVVVLSGVSTYPDLPAGAQAANSTPFVVQLEPDAACGPRLALTLTITYQDSVQRLTALEYSLPTGTVSSTSLAFQYTGPVIPIPDFNTEPMTATAVINVTGVPGRIGRMLFSIDGASCTKSQGATTVGVDHSYVSDLIFILRNPDGTNATVIEKVGGDGNNFCNTVLDDDADTSIQSLDSTKAPFSGVYRPNQPLEVFDALESNGAWELGVADQYHGDTGNLRAFSLQVWPISCAVVPDSPLLWRLEIAPGALTPAFVPVTTEYSAQLAETAQTLTMTPTTHWAGGSLWVDNASVPSGHPLTVVLPVGVHKEIVINLKNAGGVVANSYHTLVNRAPQIIASAWGARQATPVIVTLLTQANDVDGDAVTLRSVTMLTQTQGAADLVGINGSVIYTPAAGFSGLAVMQYTAADGYGGLNSAQAMVAVGKSGEGVPQITTYDRTQTVTSHLQAANGATLTLQIAPAAFTGILGSKEIVYLVFTPLLAPPPEVAPPPGRQPIGQFFTLAGFQNASPLESLHFGTPLTLTLQYDPASNINGVQPETLELWYWDESGSRWSQDGLHLIAHDHVNHAITYTVEHLSQFAYFGNSEAHRLYLPNVAR